MLRDKEHYALFLAERKVMVLKAKGGTFVALTREAKIYL